MQTPPTHDTLEDYCGTTYAAKLLGLSVGTIQTLVEKNELQAWKTQGGHRRISMPSIREYQRKHNMLMSPAENRESRLKVLLVEDDAVTREMLRDFCNRCETPVDCTAMSSGLEALIDMASIQPDVLIAMNPAALKTNVGSLREGGLIIADTGEFNQRNLDKAKYTTNPFEDGSLAKWQVLAFDISALTLESVKPFGLGNKEALRCKNMWTLGLALWMFDRDRAPLIDWLNGKFKKNPVLAEANIAALNAGHAYGGFCRQSPVWSRTSVCLSTSPD